MPFDPTLPATNSEMKSAEMRDQFNGLKDLIDGIPAVPADASALLTRVRPVLQAVGFPGPMWDVPFAEVGTLNGRPLYINALGCSLCWSTGGSNAWCGFLPGHSLGNYAARDATGPATASPIGAWPGGGWVQAV